MPVMLPACGEYADHFDDLGIVRRLCFGHHCAPEPPSTAAAFHGLTWANWGWRASLARLWYQRARAWWRRRHRDHRAACQMDRGVAVAALNRRLISATVSGIRPGSSGGKQSGLAGGGAWVSVRRRARAAAMAQIARAAVTST